MTIINQATLIRFPHKEPEAFGRKLLATTAMSEEEQPCFFDILILL